MCGTAVNYERCITRSATFPRGGSNKTDEASHDADTEGRSSRCPGEAALGSQVVQRVPAQADAQDPRAEEKMNKRLCKIIMQVALDGLPEGVDPNAHVLLKHVKKGTIVNAKDTLRANYQRLKRAYKRDLVMRGKIDALASYLKILHAGNARLDNAALASNAGAGYGQQPQGGTS